LLSSKSIQNGEDHQGIWGFLECDIKKEICRGSKIVNIFLLLNSIMVLNLSIIQVHIFEAIPIIL